MLSPQLARSALESAPDAIVIVDAGGIVVFANQQVEALFGYEPGSVVGKPVELLMPERFRQRHAGHRDRFAADGRFRPMGIGLELFARRRDGSEFPVEISLSPIRDDQRTLVAAAIRDVTDRRRIEAELVAARETADRAREAADRANQGKSRFLATASHDLRQPLQTLALLHGTLCRTIRDSQAAEALAGQEQAIGAMSRLLNALLDISKLESGAIRPELTDFRVSGLFQELRGEFAGLATSRGLELHVEPCAAGVHSDRALVEQILRNLLSNAIKYTPAGFVRLRGSRTALNVRIEVIDSGIGIDDSQLPHIYDEFYQVGVNANTVREGYGLGLSIVQRLVKLLGLQLRVQSEPGKGSVFTLELPLSRTTTSEVSAPVSAEAQRKAQAGTAPHVMIVEDDPAVLAATRMLLKAEGYRVTAAASLADALSGAREHADIEILISDYHLGKGETGTNVIDAVRGILGPGLPAILVTGDTSSVVKDLHRDEKLRLTSKPIKASELLAMLESLRSA